jgi:hypothetical protein
MSDDPWSTLVRRLDARDDGAVADAIAFLDDDRFEFRSGYGRARVARRLAGLDLDEADRAWARRYVLAVLDGRRHCAQPAIGRLAGSVADNWLRRELRHRLRSDDPVGAFRAAVMLSHVRRPGLGPADIDAMRAMVLVDVRGRPWLSDHDRRLARWLWSGEWAAALERLTVVHGPDRAPAKQVLAAMGWRPGP